MKILHVLYSGLGGHGNVFFSMVSADKDREFEYEVIFNGIENVREEYIKKCDELQIQWSFVKKIPGIDLRYYYRLLRAIKTSNANITFLHSSSYILPAFIANVSGFKKKKIIIRETQANNLKNKKEWRWLSLAFRLADRVVFLSREFNDEVKNTLGRSYKINKAAVIPNGIDLAIFHPVKKINNEPVIIGMQSRLAANKDHTTLLHAFALLKNQGLELKLKIAGDGSMKEELVSLSRKLKIDNDVEFTGMLAEKELVDFLQQLNIYVHASLGETMSTAIMQAMACGLPIIASDVPGINNMIIDHTTGILVPVKNEQLMADEIKSLLNKPALCVELANNAYEFAKQQYSNLTMFKKYKELFTQ